MAAWRVDMVRISTSPSLPSLSTLLRRDDVYVCVHCSGEGHRPAAAPSYRCSSARGWDVGCALRGTNPTIEDAWEVSPDFQDRQ